MQTLCVLIGDVVGSRALSDRAGAQRRLDAALAEVNGLLDPRQPLEPTVGDEFQGAFGSVPDASLAALLVRLAILPEMDVRCGLGLGEVQVMDAERVPRLQDGPAWWAAREALEELARPRRTALRTRYVGPQAESVDAFLLVRDSLVERLSDRGRRLLAGALRGQRQAELADAEGVGRSAVSQQFARGVGAVREARHLFGSSPAPGAGPEVRGECGVSVVLVGVWLGAVGIADLGRAGLPVPGRRRALAGLAAGALVLPGGLLVVDLSWPARAVLGLVLAW